MYKVCSIFLLFLGLACTGEQKEQLTAQQIVDKSIEMCGGLLFENSDISFDFRDRSYRSELNGTLETLTRIFENDTIKIKDVKTANGLQRYVNDTLVTLSDSLANVYANSVNSVHYFSKLPFGLNDPAVQKELLGEISIKDKEYYKIQVTFSQEGGGDDFDDVYIYWINKQTFTPDYLGYSFTVNGGGVRFREAYNERRIQGIRFVDYKNLKPVKPDGTIFSADSLYLNNGLKLLSKIELENVRVNLDSYN